MKKAALGFILLFASSTMPSFAASISPEGHMSRMANEMNYHFMFSETWNNIGKPRPALALRDLFGIQDPASLTKLMGTLPKAIRLGPATGLELIVVAYQSHLSNGTVSIDPSINVETTARLLSFHAGRIRLVLIGETSAV